MQSRGGPGAHVVHCTLRSPDGTTHVLEALSCRVSHLDGLPGSLPRPGWIGTSKPPVLAASTHSTCTAGICRSRKRSTPHCPASRSASGMRCTVSSGSGTAGKTGGLSPVWMAMTTLRCGRQPMIYVLASTHPCPARTVSSPNFPWASGYPCSAVATIATFGFRHCTGHFLGTTAAVNGCTIVSTRYAGSETGSCITSRCTIGTWLLIIKRSTVCSATSNLLPLHG